jgi:ABC-type transport system substrate-binding protein
MRLLALLPLLLAACTAEPWNSPYPPHDRGQDVLYTSFSERPKHLDPVRAYSSNEYEIIANIYEPPLQYHYLKRPYQLTPLAAARMPELRYLDAEGKPLPDGAVPEAAAFSEYRITLRPGMRYQPHPALARDAGGRLLYDKLDEAALHGIHTLSDFQHTGTREVTADDYVYQIKRMAHPAAHSPILPVMSEYIAGLDALSKTLTAEWKTLTRDGSEGRWLDLRRFDLAGVQTDGPLSFRIRIKGRYPQIQYWLAMPFFAPMPWEAERFYSQPGMARRNLSLHWHPIGSGPYLLAENNPNRRMVLERNPEYHGEAYPAEGDPGDAEAGLLRDAGKPLPLIQRVVMSLEKETIPYWNKFLQGYYDASGVSSDTFDQAIQMSGQGDMSLTDDMRGRGIELKTAVNASTYYFGFNMLDAVVGHPAGERGRKLRQAIGIAVDYEEYISIFLNGRGLAAQGPVAPGIFGHREGEAGINPVTHVWRNGQAQRRPIEDARRLLAEAGYPQGRDGKTGEPLSLYYDTVAGGADDKAKMDWWRKQFEKLGITLIVRSTDYNRFQDKMLKGNAQLFSWGWNADYPDPENFLFLLHGPSGKVKHGGENAANYANPAFDRLFEQLKVMDNTPERQALLDQAVGLLREDAPWLWGVHPLAFTLHHGWYQNAKPNLMANNTLKYKRVDAARREALRREWNPPVLWPAALAALALLLFTLPAIAAWRRRQHAAALPAN